MAKNKLLRITQMNAIFLDNEIYKTFLQLIRDCYRYLPPGLTAPYDQEINLIAKMVLLRFSLLQDSSTFGQQLLSIGYDNMTNLKKVLYLLANCSDYVEQKFDFSVRFPFFNGLIRLMDFVNLSLFLQNGVKPQLVDRLLGLNQDYTKDNAARHFTSKYLAREVLWNGFIEIFMNVLPLINYHKLSRTARKYNPFRTKPTFTSVNRQGMTLNTKCAHCSESPIIPYHMGCCHVFCYVCLKGNQTADPRYECPICEHSNATVICEKVILS